MARPRPHPADTVLWTLLPAAVLLSITAGQAVAGLAVLRWAASPGRRWPAGLRIPVLAFLGWAAASTLAGGSGIPSLRDGFGKWVFVLLLPAGWSWARSGGDLRWPLTGLLAAVAGLLPFSLREFLAGPGNRAGAFSGGGPHLGSNVMMALVIAAAVATAPVAPALRGIAVAMAGLLAAGLALTLNRAAALGAAVGIAVTLALRRPVLLAVALLTVVGAMAARPDAKAVLRLRAGLLYPVDETARERTLMWSSGLRMIRDRPWAGVGGRRNFIRVYEASYRRAENRESEPGHVHNSWIQAAVLHGLPGLGLLCWWCAVLLRHAGPALRRRMPSGAFPAGEALLPLLLAVLVNACFDFVLADGQHALMWYALTGLLLGSAGRIRPAGSRG